MPRRGKGVRLWLRPEERNASGKLIRRSAWFIIDGKKHVTTGCLAHETAAAETKLAQFIASKYAPQRRERDIEQIAIADVIAIYADDRGSEIARDNELYARLERLNNFWADRTLAEINGETCREYVRVRGNSSGARRELEDLRAAINHHSREGYHRGTVRVLLPKKGKARTRWLSRKEAAALLWACWRARETQTIHRGPQTNKSVETDRRPLRHIARFILVGLYTGTRSGAIVSASLKRESGRSFVDLQHGVFYRLADGATETKKRQPPIPLPPRLLAHLRRWATKGIIRNAVIEWNGQPVSSVKTGFRHAVELAGLSGDVSPHTLRHTCATWLMQAGVDKWEAAGFLGMTVEMLDRVYGHHHPKHLRTAAEAIGYKRGTQSLTIMLTATREGGSNAA